MEPTKGQGAKTLGVKLPPNLHAQFVLVTQMDGLSLADGVVRAVELYVNTVSAAPDFAERAAATVAEIEAEAAARRNAVQALFGQGDQQAAGEVASAGGRRGAAKSQPA